MNITIQNLVSAMLRTWAWDANRKILYLSAKDIDSQLFCNMIHKLTYFSPKRIFICLNGEWYEVNEKYLGLLKEASQKVKKEKTELYKILVEKNNEVNTIRNKLCISPFYGSLYLNKVLEFKPFPELLIRCGFKNENVFQTRILREHSYAIGHLFYSIDIGNSLYHVPFLSDDYFWINKELSMILRHAYSDEMLRSGRLKQIYEYRFKTGLKLLNVLTLDEVGEPIRRQLVKHAVYSSTGLSKVFPLIIDKSVKNFFLDDVGKRIYVDHVVFGRLNTNLVFKEKDFESLITLIKRESNLDLDYANPSIKTSIFIDKIPIRVSIDIPPLTLGRGVIDVRKHMTGILSIKYLFKTKYFFPESAALLIFATLNRANISIIGEPNSGKTSLLNFLSYFMPPWWRIIHIEDALETLPPKISGQYRVVYIVEPFESKEARSTKTIEIVKVLHRTPSYLILGEIQTKSHVKAMFQAVSAGLRVMHTAHASSSSGFIKRLVEVYDIPRILVSELDLIVVVKKIETGDSIKRFISEVTIVDKNSNLKKYTLTIA